MAELDLSKIVQIDFPDNQYVKEETKKTQIYLHHTVSGAGVEGDISSWLKDSQRIATHVIIDRNGVIHQCFSSKFWGYHLGVKSDVFKKYGLPYKNLDSTSIGVEIDAYGWLTESNGIYKTCYGNQFKGPITKYELAFKGYKHYETYTDKQIESLRQLLVFWCNRFQIPTKYNEDMWDVSKNALSGAPGVWTHVSVRNDKSDCHKQPELINMLKSLK